MHNNIVILMGHLATDFELRTDNNGRSRGWFRLAVNRVGSKSDVGADFFNVQVWNGLAEQCAKSIHGKQPDKAASKVAVQGQLRTYRKDIGGGQFKDIVSVNAHSVTFLSPKDGTIRGLEATSEEPATVADDIPF